MDTPTLPSVLCANATAFLSNPSQLNGSHFRFSLFLSGLFSPIVCLSFCASLLCPPHTCCRSATRITPCRCISKKLPNKSAMQPVVQLINYASPMSSTSRLYYNIFYTCSPSLHVLTLLTVPTWKLAVLFVFLIALHTHATLTGTGTEILIPLKESILLKKIERKWRMQMYKEKQQQQ